MGNLFDKCIYAEACGGCTYQGMDYEKQLAKKLKEVETLFKGICKVEPIVGMYRPYFYRNKVHAVLGKDKNGEIIAGTYKEGTHELVAVDKCMLQDEKADEIIGTLKGLFKSFKYEPYDEDKRIGLIRHILIRRGFSTKEIMVVLVTAGNIVPSKKNFVNALREAHPEITTIVQNINERATSMVLGDRENVWYGRGYIEDVLCGSRFRISSKSFYQINPQQTEKLYKAAIKMAELTGKETVVDAYCGIGTIGITASKKARRVIGVELNGDAVSDAIANAELNGVKNCSFYKGDAGAFLVDYAAKEKADVIFMDPPRSGSSPEFLNSIVKIKPEKVVYISCNPETQVRDLAILRKNGYEVKECRVFDLFPWTGCVETVALLSLKTGTPKIEVTMEVDSDSNYSPEEKATYQKIKEYVKDKYGVNVHTRYIAEVKRMCGIDMGENYNKSKKDNPDVKHCPPEKIEFIREALKYYNLII